MNVYVGLFLSIVVALASQSCFN